MRFFHGQLLRAEDLAREQEYFRERLRRHNRALHGFGVVSGLTVEVSQEAGDAGSMTLSVSPGYALTPGGHEIVVCEAVSRALSFATNQRIVVVRYDERLVDPVPAATGTPGDDGVQFSAVEETYVVDVLEAGSQAADDLSVVLAAVDFDDHGHVVVDTSARQQASDCR